MTYDNDNDINNDFDGDSKDPRLKQRFRFKACRTCGGYGYNFNTANRAAQKCPSCLGDKVSRDPHDYDARDQIPPLPPSYTK